MDEGRKRVIGIMAAILASLRPRTDKLIAASVQWAETGRNNYEEG
jgi:hypothetical protein